MEVKQSLAFVLILLNLACQAKADCDAPTGFKNAKLLSDLSDQPAVFEEKHELLYECNIGFRPATGRGSRCWNGRWTEIRCERIFCKWLPAPDNGRRLDSNAYVGEYTTFACNEGYQLIGYKTLLCRADGKWRPSDPPVCKPVSCGRLPWLANGEAFQATRDGNLNLYGSVVKLSCKFGFDLIKGSKERRCQADGTWSGTQPVCEEPTCPKLEPFYNGVIYYQNDDVISLYHVAEIECNDGSDVFPEGTRFVTCVEGNTWDVNNITCERHLTISPPSHMKLYTGQGRYRPRITSSRRLKSRTSLHIECEYKHELVDGKTNKYYEVNSLQVRIFNGTVVPELPLCRKERCNLVADHCSFMDTDGNKLVGKVEHNTVVVKMCDPDFEFEPSDKRKEPRQRSTCNQGVIDFPRCIPKRCVIPPGRRAKWYRRNYNDGDLINNGQTVKRTCNGKKELFYPEKQIYEENSNIFSSTCRTGVWSNGVFPICKEKRCNIVTDHCSFMDTDGNNLVGKVEHNTVVVKKCDPGFEFEPSDKRKEPNQKSTCDRGVIDFPRCIPKRCEIPHDRHARIGEDIYTADELVDSEEQVVVDCREREEVYYPESKTYAKTFTTTCRSGLWSDDKFPICKEERCSSPNERDGTRFLLDEKVVQNGDKLEHGTILTKSCNKGYEDKTNLPTKCSSGSWINDEPCTGKPCTLPAIEHTRDNETPKQLAHNGQVRVECKNGYDMIGSDVANQNIKTNCNKGNLAPSLDNIKCVPKGCSGTSKANVYRATASGVKEDEPASSFDHEEYAIVKCHDHYVLTQDSKPVSDWKSKTSRCVFGKWEPEYACEKDACHVDVPENGKLWIKTANKTKQGKTLMKNGYTGIFNCDQNYTLDNDTIVQHTDGFPITCVGNKLNTTLPTCVKSVPDSEESADMFYVNNGVQMGEATESPADEKSSIMLTIPETTAAAAATKDATISSATTDVPLASTTPFSESPSATKAAATKDATISSATTDVPLASTTPFSESPSTTKEEFSYDYPGVDEVKSAAATKDATISSATTDVPLASTTPFSESPSATKDEVYYGYDYPGVDEVEPEETCPNPANGRLVRSYLSYYNVVCDDGYELYVVENDDDYKCSNGKWMSKIGFEAECNENDCEITDEILAIMKVFNRVNGKEQYVSRVRKITPNQKYYFDCKQENHEPVKLLFNCSRGNWTAIERDPNWKMQIDGMEPSCRKALCDPVCQFGGTCVKDGMCKCVPGTTGKACEIPVCNPACASNGGKCEAPNTCKCEEPRYGINCEQVGCDRPNFPVHAIMKGTKKFFEDGDVLSSDQLTCSKGYILSNTTRCIGNLTWSGKAECLKETHFELEVKVGNSQWAGSWGQLYVSILSEQGGIIHRMAFEKPDFEALYPGHLYTLGSSTTGETRKVGQLKLLLGPGNQDINDDLEIDHIRLTIQRDADNTKKEYDFSSVGWLTKDQKKLVRPDTGVFRLKYRLGDAYGAGSGNTLQVSFEGNLGHTPFYLMSSGRRNWGQTYYKVIDGEYVGQIHAVTIKNDHYVINHMQIDYIQLTVSHEDKEEKYLFKNVGWIDSRYKKIRPEITADQETCPNPANGRLVRSYLSYYNVVCDDGYELDVVENDDDYKCSNGKWMSKNFGFEAECNEKTHYGLEVKVGNSRWAGSWGELYVSILFEQETHFELEVKVGNSQWAGSFGQLNVTILSEQGEIIHRMAFEKPDFKALHAGHLYTLLSSTTGETRKVGHLKLSLGPGNGGSNDNLEIDHIRLTIQRAADNIKEEYDFSSVGWLDKNQAKFVRPDMGVFRLKYRLGDAYTADSSDTFHISFEGSLGRTPFYLMSSGRRYKGQTYYKVIDGEYVGQIYAVTIKNDRYVKNDMQIDYIQLTVSHEDKEEKYLFRNVGWIGSLKEIKSEITADQPEMPSCQDDFDVSPGWVGTKLPQSEFSKAEHVKSDEDCKNLCRRDGNCKVAAVSGYVTKNLTCKLVYTNQKSAFLFGGNGSTHRLYTRKCQMKI